MVKKANEDVAPVERTSAGLREAIFDEIDALRNGTSNATRANAVSKLASSVVETVRVEIEVQKHLTKQPESMPQMTMGEPLKLGA